MIAEKPHSSLPTLVRGESERIEHAFSADGDPAAVLASRTALVDEAVTRAWREHLQPEFPAGLAVLAVGGYGRRELFPHSDIDVLLLVKEPPGNALRDALAGFQQAIWDASLRLSHSVRTVPECCELHPDNVELNVSLLDERFLAGDMTLYQDLDTRLPRFLQSQREPLARHLCRLTHQRHSRFHETIHHLEPNIKETPGGVRDLHLLGWLDRLLDTSNAAAAEIDAARQFLGRLRCFLHYRSKRDDNLLSFEAQEAFAADAASFMRDQYRQARTVHRTGLRAMDLFEAKGNSLLAGFRDWRSRLSTTEFTVSRDRIMLRSPQRLVQDGGLALRMFALAGRHAIRLHPETERRLRQDLPRMLPLLGEGSGLWDELRQVLSQPHAGVALRAMHDSGFLGALFPEWTAIECYVIRDFNHRYTVDEHTLIAIENLEKLRDGEGGEQDRALRRLRGLLEEIEDPALLRFALLFHDVGKEAQTGAHAVESAALVEAAGQRIGMPEESIRLVVALIEQHLVLSSAMTGRDLDDPATARWLADRVGTIEVLKYLTLLTYADISAVHPTSMTPWRLEQLWRVHRTVERELKRELQDDRIQAAAQGDPDSEAFLKGFPTRYLRTHSTAQIAAHVALEGRRKDAGIAVECVRRGAGLYELTVLAKDRLSLFSAIAGSLAGFGLNIVKAEAFANQQGTILDTFVFSDPTRNLDLNPPELDRLRQTIERVVLGKTDPRSLLRNRRTVPPPSRTSSIDAGVTFDNDASEVATLVEVVAQDRPGLLYDLASAFSAAGCSIEVVLIDTEAHKALDVFYVTVDGRKLDDALRSRLQDGLLRACGS